MKALFIASISFCAVVFSISPGWSATEGPGLGRTIGIVTHAGSPTESPGFGKTIGICQPQRVFCVSGTHYQCNSCVPDQGTQQNCRLVQVQCFVAPCPPVRSCGFSKGQF